MISTRTTRPSSAAPASPFPTGVAKKRGRQPILVNIEEACDLLEISARTWRRLRAAGGALAHLTLRDAPQGEKGQYFEKREVVAAKRDIAKRVEPKTTRAARPDTATGAPTLDTPKA